MAIDPIVGSNNVPSTLRAQAAPASGGGRVLNATRVPTNVIPGKNVTAFSIQGTSKNGGPSIKLPRGSIVDVLT